MLRKTYFLPPSWGLSTDEIVLGSVIPNLRNPHKPLSCSTLPSAIESTIFTRIEEKCSGIVKSSNNWDIGLFSSFIHFVTLGGELSYTSSSMIEVAYSADTMTTRRFKPSHSYIQKAVDDGAVKSHLKMGGIGAKVFMVTGIKTVQNVTITTKEEKANKTNFHIGVETPTDLLTIGLKVGCGLGTSQARSSVIVGPIVFAYEVEKLQVHRSGEGFTKEHNKGAMLSQQDEVENVVLAAGNKLDEDELDDFGLEELSALDDGTGNDCCVVIPYVLSDDSDD